MKRWAVRVVRANKVDLQKVFYIWRVLLFLLLLYPP
jgi:hypothetical protein